ncbi:HTH_Tnp_Tc3_2 domain-containing protein [Trichonephila clavipes]|nr:HTH_Tnp_Tc3_2 domain-containing protein [Trichonephila clavipes]
MEWRSVVFSVESRFCLGASDGRVLVRRRPGELLQPNCRQPRQSGLTPGVMSVDMLPWPARSSDLSPIEHVWVSLTTTSASFAASTDRPGIDTTSTTSTEFHTTKRHLVTV